MSGRRRMHAELVILVGGIPISQGFVVSAAPDFLLAGIRSDTRATTKPGSLFDMLAQGLFSPRFGRGVLITQPIILERTLSVRFAPVRISLRAFRMRVLLAKWCD